MRVFFVEKCKNELIARESAFEKLCAGRVCARELRRCLFCARCKYWGAMKLHVCAHKKEDKDAHRMGKGIEKKKRGGLGVIGKLRKRRPVLCFGFGFRCFWGGGGVIFLLFFIFLLTRLL